MLRVVGWHRGGKGVGMGGVWMRSGSGRRYFRSYGGDLFNRAKVCWSRWFSNRSGAAVSPQIKTRIGKCELRHEGQWRSDIG